MKLECRNLTKKYGDKRAVDEVSLVLESGHIYGLIGRNGAGKTTLLSLMSNQNPATSGAVTLDGEDIWENRKAIDRICFARELSANAESGVSGYSVRNYLKTASCYYRNWDQQMADELVKKFGLEPKKKLGKLSKGMLSMVTIIVALASKAAFTFLDEPVAGLDVIARRQFYQLLMQEYTQTGRTFVISTHIIEEAADILEEVVILDNGRILLKEPTESLLARACTVSGLDEAVTHALNGLPAHGKTQIGRKTIVTVLLEEGQQLDLDCDVTVSPVSLQDLFAALCGEALL